MTKLKSWCHCTSQTIRAKQELHTLVANAMNQAEAIDAIAGVMPGHYASETRIADIFARLGKHASADYTRVDFCSLRLPMKTTRLTISITVRRTSYPEA